MPTGLNTYGDIGNATAGYYSKKLLAHAQPVIVLERYGMTKPMPKNYTKIIEFRRSKPFAPATVPLTEGTPPSGSDFGYDTISVQIQQYGDWSSITDVVADTSKDMVLRDMSVRQGEQIGETREALTWDVVRAGTGVTYANGETARNALDHDSALGAEECRSVVAQLELQKAKKYTMVLNGSPNYETFAIEPSYVAVGHTDMKPILRDLKGGNINDTFTPVARYGASQSTSHPREVGNFEDTRFVLSPDLHPFRGHGATDAETGLKATGGKADVYPMLFLGRDAWGCIALRGASAVKPMVLNANVPRGSDPLGQRGTIGWKFWFACMVLNEAWMRRLEVTCVH